MKAKAARRKCKLCCRTRHFSIFVLVLFCLTCSSCRINATVIGSKPGGKRGKGRETKKPEEDLAEEPEADENDDVDE